jgi:hypothetical protein
MISTSFSIGGRDGRRSVSGWKIAAGVLSVALMSTVWAERADAKVLELWVQGQAGGIYGIYGTEDFDPAAGVNPDESAATDDFFKVHSGGTVGAQVGVELFFIDAIIDFQQFYNDEGLSATLTLFMLGFDWDFPLSENWEISPYGMGGFAFATYNNDWLKDDQKISRADLEGRGAVARLGARLEYKLHEMFRIGVDGGAGYHYMLQTDKAANDLEGHSHGFHAYVMGVVRFQWEPFAQDEKKKTSPEPEGGEPMNLEDPVQDSPPADEPPSAHSPPPASSPPPAEPAPAADEGSQSESSPPAADDAPEENAGEDEMDEGETGGGEAGDGEETDEK